MSSTINTITHTIWAWLPALTIGLRLATTFIGCYPIATLMIHRLHHRMPRRSSTRSTPISIPGARSSKTDLHQTRRP